MSRTPDPGFDPRIADWLEADPVTAPPEVLRTVDGALPSIPQRRALRLPGRSLPMSRFMLVAATAILVGALGVGIAVVGGRQPTTEPSPVPADASPTPSATRPTEGLAAYYRAHDAVCQAATTAKEGLAARYAAIFDPRATPEAVADGIEALNEMATLAGATAADLLAIDAPADLATDHVQHATRMEDIGLMIREVVLLLRAGRVEEARAVDKTTDRLAARMGDFEREYNLFPCP